tara:strand:+ start:977 stop:1123 length:147 start_codon:yes stop_codon:yes gene_type:complete
MSQREAELACVRVTNAIEHLKEYYAVIVVKSSGNREVVIRQKGDIEKC